MPTPLKLPADYEEILTRFASQPEDVLELWRYGMAVILIEDGKMRLEHAQRMGEDVLLTVRTEMEEVFTVVKPAMPVETEALLVEQIRLLIEWWSGGAGDQDPVESADHEN